MKHTRFVSSVFLIALLAVAISPAILNARMYDNNVAAKPVLMTDRVEVQFETDVDVARINSGAKSLSLGVSSLDDLFARHSISRAEKMFPWRNGEKAKVDFNDMSKMFVVDIPEDADYGAVVEDLKKNPFVRSVDPVYAMPLDIIPNDPQYIAEWWVKKIHDTLAWEYETGSEDAIIAIADAGVLYYHPDLADNIWVNPAEDKDGDGVPYDFDDADGIDDDGNGIPDDIIGYDFFSGLSGLTVIDADPSVPDNDPLDYNGHGTHCAGIAAMVTNNGNYGSGVAGGWGGGNGPYRGPRIMCLRVGASCEHPDFGYETGYVNSTNCAQAIDYAANNGATVVNCSWGSSSSGSMASALAQANINGMVVCHSAGNDATFSTSGGYMDNYFYLGYEVALSVAATQTNDMKASFSNWGPYVDVSAPGVSIWSTYSNHYVVDFENLQGTSMSSPMVAGLAGLIKSKMPAWDKFTIDSVIKATADDIDPVNPLYAGFLGSGRINAYAAVMDLPDARFEAVGDLVGPAPLTVQFNDLSPNSPTSWDWTFGDGDASSDQNPSHEYTDPGLYDVALTIDEPRGTTTETLRRLVMVTADTIKIDSIMVPPSASDQQVVLPISMTNNFQGVSMSIPTQAKMDGAVPVGFQKIAIDSISYVGTRCEDFEYKQISPYDEGTHSYGFILRSDETGGSDYLQPGTGTILNVYFTLDGGLPNGTVFTLELKETAFAKLDYTSNYYDYVPEFIPGKIVVYAPYICGDVDESQQVDVLDIIYLINYKFKDGPPPNEPASADVNLDTHVDVLDIIYLIDYKFKGGPEPCAE